MATTDYGRVRGVGEMRVFHLFKSKLLIAATIIVASAALARADQNDKHNRGDDRNDNRSSSSQRSNNNSGSSSNNSPSLRSLNNSNNGGGGNASRSSNNDSGRSIQNFSKSNSQNVSRGSDSGNASSGARNTSRNDGNNAVRNFRSDTNRGGASGDAGQARTFLKQNKSDQQSQQSGGQSNSKNTVQTQQNQVSGNQNQQGQQRIQTLRPNDDQVRNFLQLKNNENTRIAENDDRRNKGDSGQNGRNQSNGNSNGSSGRQIQGGNQGSRNGGQSNAGQNQNGQKQINSSQGNNGPQLFKRGDLNSKDSSRDSNSNRDSNRDVNSNQDRNFKIGDHRNDGDRHNDGKHDDRTSVKDFFDHNKGVGSRALGDNHGDNRGDSHGGDNHGFDRKFHDRDFHGNETAKVEFNKWNNAWKGKTGNGKDNRDWSGKWRSGDRFVAADRIRHDFYSHHDFHDLHHVPFAANWWGDHHGHSWGFWGDYAVRRHRPWYWWNWSTGPELTTFCNFGWNTPYYWDYGPGEYIYCDNGNVYVNGRLYEPAPVFYAQTVRLIDQAPLLDADAAAEAEWMPLGVFAVTPDGMNQPSMLVQLAITKTGILGGTATDQQAGVSFNIQGTVDNNSQRAVWSYVDANNQRIVMESSINNLTQNESTGLIHYDANDQKVVVFVRLPEPDEQAGDLPGPRAADAGARLVIPPAGGQLPPPEEQ